VKPRLRVTPREDAAEVRIALRRSDEKNHAPAGRDRLRPDDGTDARLVRGLEKKHEPVQAVGVRERQRVHAERLGPTAERVGTGRPPHQGVVTVNV